MMIWALCIEEENSRYLETPLRNAKSHPGWGFMYAFSSERVFMNEILSLFYRSTAFEITEIYGMRIARREPSKHLKINLAVVVSFSRIVPMHIKDTLYTRRSDTFEIFFSELRRFLVMATIERQHLWDEISNSVDVYKTICTMSIHFERTMDFLDFHLLQQLVEILESLEEFDITYLLGTLRDPSWYRKDPIDPLTQIELTSPMTNNTSGSKWVFVRSRSSPYSLNHHKYFWRVNRHWYRRERISLPADEIRRGSGSSSSSELHPLDHLGQLARLADLKTVLN